MNVNHLSDSVCMDIEMWERNSECGGRDSVCPGHTAQCYESGSDCLGSSGSGTCLDMSHRVCDKDRTYSSYGKKTSGADVCGKDGENEDMFHCNDEKRCISYKLLCDGIPQWRLSGVS